jgi:hypothetical protein
MNILIDLIGAAIIGSVLILMMITFQFQLYETSDRLLYTMNMTDHMEMTATRLNNIIALAGAGIDPGDTVVHADEDSLVFMTYWDFLTETKDESPNKLSIKLAAAPNPFGTQVLIAQNDEVLQDLGNIFWVNELKFRYYDIDDNLTTEEDDVMAAELRVSFFRDAPRGGSRDIQTKLQFKCFFMNAYMQVGNPS